MKVFSLTIAVSLIVTIGLSGHQSVISKKNIITSNIFQQDRQDVAFNNMMTELNQLHNAIFNLPFEDNYIRSTIVPYVNAKRAELAPHYPKRENSGSTNQEIMKQMRIWFDTFPLECSSYLNFLKNYIESNS